MSQVFTEPSGFDSFPDGVREDVEGLVWLGYLEDSFDFCGHSFVIRTLRGDEELLAGLIAKEYTDTVGEQRAWAWSQIALALVSIDGDENFCPPIGPDSKAYARARFAYITQRWFWPTAQAIFNKYAALLERQQAAVDNLESLSQGSLPTFTPFAGSLTDRGDSEPSSDVAEEILEELDSTESNPDS